MNARTWIFLAGRMLSNLGEQLLMYALPLLIFEFTQDAGKSGQAFLIEWLPAILVLPFAGQLLDRISERKMYAGSELLRALLCVIAFVCLRFTPLPPFLVLTVVAAALAVLHAQTYVALETTIVRRFGSENVGRIQSLVQGIESTGEVAGPALAGLAVVLLTKQGLMVFSAAGFLLSALSIFALRAGRACDGPKEHPPVLAGLALSCRAILSRPRLYLLSFIPMSLNLLLGVVLATNPAVATQVLGVGDREFALIGTAGGVTSAIMMFLLPLVIDRLRPATLAFIALTLLAGACALLGTSHQLLPFVAGYALLTCAVSTFNVFVRIERAKIVPAAEYGKVISVIVLLNRISLPIAGLLVAVGAGPLGAQRLVFVISLFVVLAVGLLVRHLSKEAAQPVAQEGFAQ